MSLVKLFLFFLIFVPVLASAEGIEAPAQEGEPANGSAKTRKHHSRSSHDQTKKGRTRREKDAEGTQAPNRFDADINTKSKYRYGGQPLEVDTD